VEIKNGYLRAAAIKRHRDRSRLTSKEWRDLLEMGMFGERRRTWHDQLKQAERKIVQLTREKEELKRRLAPFESSLLWKAAKRFSRNSPDRDRASVHNHSASLRNEAPNIPSSTADPDSTEASVSLPASVQITPKLVAAPDRESHKANGQGHQVSREQVLEEAWVRYLDRVKQMKPERWVMILSSPTYWQNSLHQRTWQLAGALQAEGIPVVLVCEEGAPGEEWIPAYTGSPCIELPRSVFEQKAHEWLSADPGCRQKVLIITQPELLAAKLLNLAKIRGWQIVYDAALDWEALSRWETIPIYSPAVEQYLLYHADLVTAVTPALKAKLKRFRPEDRLLVVPNGSTGEGLGSNEIQTGLQGVEPDKSQEASGGEDSKNPVANRQVCIGYWGPLDKPWLDWETLFMLAKQRPTWRFELVETERTNRDRLPVIGWPYNIRVYGKRSVQEVLKLSSRWQAALYPFFDRELAQGSDLATLNLLLAQGIPVVCLGADPKSASPLRMVVEEKEEALAMLEQAISQAGQASPVSRSRDLTRTQAMSQTQAMIQDPGQKEADAHHCLSGWPNHLAELWKKLEREHPQVWDLFPEGETGL